MQIKIYKHANDDLDVIIVCYTVKFLIFHLINNNVKKEFEEGHPQNLERFSYIDVAYL